MISNRNTSQLSFCQNSPIFLAIFRGGIRDVFKYAILEKISFIKKTYYLKIEPIYDTNKNNKTSFLIKTNKSTNHMSD